MNSAAPKISVVIPCFNVAAFVTEAVESIRSQSFSEIEVICVDDGSADGTREELKTLAKQDGRIRLLFAEHAGISAARNRGLALARSEIIANLDADDVALPTRLERQWEYLQRHPECVALGTQALLTTTTGSPLGPLTAFEDHAEIDSELLRGRGFALIHTSAMFRKSAVMAVSGYNEQLPFAVDLDLYLKLAEIGRLANLPETLVRVRRHAASTTAIDHQQRGMQVKQKILEAAYRRRGLPPQELALWQMEYPHSSAEVHAGQVVMALRNGYYRTAVGSTRSMCRALLAERRGLWRSCDRLARGITRLLGGKVRNAIVGSPAVRDTSTNQVPGKSL